jgi:hypothetical protein
LEDPGLDRRIILRLIFRKGDVRTWTGSSWLRIGTSAGTCECGNESTGSIHAAQAAQHPLHTLQTEAHIATLQQLF